MIDVMHQILYLTRVLDAAQRGYGYTADDVPAYNEVITGLLNRMSFLHQVIRSPVATCSSIVG